MPDNYTSQQNTKTAKPRDHSAVVGLLGEASNRLDASDRRHRRQMPRRISET